MNKNVYGGVLQQPTTNYSAVRDGRRGSILYTRVDLSVARTDTGTGANAPLAINVAGNSFYVDADPVDGYATVEFQDSGSDLSSARIYVSPGAIFNIPFTQFKITNPAQAGKSLTIIYGTDIDFQPGSVSQIAIAGNVSLVDGTIVGARPESQTGFFSDGGALVASTPLTIVTPATNVNGLVVLSADMNFGASATLLTQVFITKSSAPVSIFDGSVILASKLIVNTATQNGSATLPKEQYVSAGQGLYFISSSATASTPENVRYCRYKLL